MFSLVSSLFLLKVALDPSPFLPLQGTLLRMDVVTAELSRGPGLDHRSDPGPEGTAPGTGKAVSKRTY